MPRYALADADWDRLAPLLPGRPGTRGRSGDDNRRFLHAVNWMARNGGPWRDLPPELGRWNTVWRRFDRWSRGGVWQRLFDAFQDPDLDWLLLDSTTARAHQHAAGARKGGSRRSTPPRGRGSGAHAAA
jgi:transposase